jgi:hypothetical protein
MRYVHINIHNSPATFVLNRALMPTTIPTFGRWRTRYPPATKTFPGADAVHSGIAKEEIERICALYIRFQKFSQLGLLR